MNSSNTSFKKAIGDYILDEAFFMDQYSSVFHGTVSKTGEQVLIRNIQLSTLQNIENSQQLIQSELNMLKKYQGPNVIKFISLVPTKNNLYLIYESAQATLETYLRKHQFIPETTAIKFLHEILNGYSPLKKDGQLLKSLRLDSFMVKDKVVKFYDLGLTKNLEKFKSIGSQAPNFKFLTSLAPEIFFAKQQNSTCDIWSIGLVFYQILFGELPWKCSNIDDYFKAAISQPANFNNKFQKLSKLTVSVLEKMLNPDIAQRITYDQLLNDPVFTQFIDNLQHREQKVIEKIKKKPECWQAAGLMYTEDPIISIFDLETSIRKSASTFKSKLRPFEELKSVLLTPEKGSKSVIHLRKKQNNSNDSETLSQLESQIDGMKDSSEQIENMMSSSIKKSKLENSNKQVSVNSQLEQMIEYDTNSGQEQNSALDKIIEQAANEVTKETPKIDLSLEFRKMNFNINHIIDYFLLYGYTATSAAKLFKTDLIIFQCFFLYKRLLKSLLVLYEVLARGDNIFKFKHWEEFKNSIFFLKIVEIVENHIDRVTDIFQKIFQDCQKKLKNPSLQIEKLKEVVNDDLDEIQVPFNSFLYPYLEKFLKSEHEISTGDRKIAILKHKIEVIDCLLLNKMPEVATEDSIMSIEAHKEAMRSDDMKLLLKYYNEQYEKLDLLKYNNFIK